LDYADTLNRVINQLAATVAPASPGTRADRFAAFRSSSATELAAAMDQVLGSFDQMGTHGGGYGGDLFGDAQRFAGLACALGCSRAVRCHPRPRLAHLPRGHRPSPP
jgi:hypothetical protein